MATARSKHVPVKWEREKAVNHCYQISGMPTKDFLFSLLRFRHWELCLPREPELLIVPQVNQPQQGWSGEDMFVSNAVSGSRKQEWWTGFLWRRRLPQVKRLQRTLWWLLKEAWFTCSFPCSVHVFLLFNLFVSLKTFYKGFHASSERTINLSTSLLLRYLSHERRQ